MYHNVVTAIAPVNIATIKYWGKRDEELILPINDSISVTLSTDQMHAKTTVMASTKFTSDKIWLNGREESINNPRLQSCLKYVRELAKEHNGADCVLKDCKIHICSINNFPTAAGLASSAAGYACLVFALAKLYNLKVDITKIARQGSGSACRSIYGGLVRWHAGVESDGSDSIATQIAPASFWPDLHVSDKKKTISSTTGMARTVKTSQLLKHRVEKCVPEHIMKMKQAIMEKNFELFAEITMKDSNQFHSVCMDTYPPFVYMNDTSHKIVSFVHEYNEKFNCNKLAYTFDAGANACLFLLKENIPHAISSIINSFPLSPTDIDSQNYVRGITTGNNNLPKIQDTDTISVNAPGLLKYIIHTSIGDGPRILSDEHLLTDDGFPREFF